MTKLRLTLTVEYKEETFDPRAARAHLINAVRHAVGNGLLTGDTPMEVEEWSHYVQQVVSHGEQNSHFAVEELKRDMPDPTHADLSPQDIDLLFEGD